MGAAAPVIFKVSTPEYGQVVVDASDGKRYHANLTALSAVHCFPKTFEEWRKVTPDGHGLALTWTTRFEVHIDQVIGLANRVESTRQSA